MDGGSSGIAGDRDTLGSSLRRSQYKGGFTPETLHEPFKSLGDHHDSHSNLSASQLRDVPLTSNAQQLGSTSDSGATSLSSSVRKHTANRRSMGSAAQLNAFLPVDEQPSSSSRGSSAQSSPKASSRLLERDPSPLSIGMGPAPGRGYFKHKVIPSLTSGVPPVLAGSKPKGWPSSSLTTTNATNSSSSRPPRYDSPAAWMVYYFLANLSLTLYNKLLMNKFPFAWSLTAIHALSGCIGAQLCLSKGLFVQQRLSTRENIVLVAFSSLYTVNIAVSNLSLNLVTVPVSLKATAAQPQTSLTHSALLLIASSSIK